MRKKSSSRTSYKTFSRITRIILRTFFSSLQKNGNSRKRILRNIRCVRVFCLSWWCIISYSHSLRAHFFCTKEREKRHIALRRTDIGSYTSYMHMTWSVVRSSSVPSCVLRSIKVGGEETYKINCKLLDG